MILQDLRTGFRVLVKNPGPAAVAVPVLALGIGLTTAMFSIVDGLLIRPLPFADGDRLFHLAQSRNDLGTPDRVAGSQRSPPAPALGSRS